MVPSQRGARAALFRHIDGIFEKVSPATLESTRDKVMAGGTPANPAALGD